VLSESHHRVSAAANDTGATIDPATAGSAARPTTHRGTTTGNTATDQRTASATTVTTADRHPAFVSRAAATRSQSRPRLR